ncbi:hypothetical protein [Sporolactobacillus pectinivorans]|uniref:hypothetical protein n=1 Tax=Sporolactobacillus pectinivorans TaxID=1591408 RepID=UPI000C26A3E1|nr:hypothetical protein [Sporolactobacillus pectinivorans]
MKHEKEQTYQKLNEVRIEAAKRFRKSGLDNAASDFLATKYILINETAISTYLVIDELAAAGKIIEQISTLEDNPQKLR